MSFLMGGTMTFLTSFYNATIRKIRYNTYNQ
ncbi:hypothetical protein HDF14_005381 [Edaphobacter lichenicola]|uniref:Uncharacterized protein n=1 Tax=Tunturiibacter gelidiferens TaxID=3069689 RepID=A0A9X0U867_9BACT|nr:hypothetical protein [Edaphobacter lichenicola]